MLVFLDIALQNVMLWCVSSHCFSTLCCHVKQLYVTNKYYELHATDIVFIQLLILSKIEAGVVGRPSIFNAPLLLSTLTSQSVELCIWIVMGWTERAKQ